MDDNQEKAAREAMQHAAEVTTGMTDQIADLLQAAGIRTAVVIPFVDAQDAADEFGNHHGAVAVPMMYGVEEVPPYVMVHALAAVAGIVQQKAEQRGAEALRKIAEQN